jgi:arylsulfatase A-like enzyme
MNKLIIYISMVFYTLIALLPEGFAESPRPNIVWMFSDDHAYQAVGAYNSRFKGENLTPNIDSLARDGMVFDRAYVGNSICAPSRATLLTGKHSHQNGKHTNGGSFNHDQQQFQKILQASGYQTAMIGKIHLSGKMQGFDYWEVLPGQGQYINPKFVTENGPTQYPGHSSDVITDRAVNWLKTGMDDRKPFMLMVHFKAPHRRWTPAERFIEPFSKRTFPEPDNLLDDYEGRGSGAANQKMTIAQHMSLGADLKSSKRPGRKAWLATGKPEGDELTRKKYQWYMQDYLACIAGVDENVGRILDYLKEQGLDKNTIVMYSSDQGFYLGEHGWYDKRWMYEESYRTPLLARWPGTIAPGSRNDDLVQNIDFAETFLDIAGAEIPADMQGNSLIPLMQGTTPKDWRTSLYYHYYEGGGHGVRRHEGVSDKRYKLIRYYSKGADEYFELFDLKNDPGEMKSMYDNPEYASVRKKMHAELDRLKKFYGVN